ncbi:MAG: LytTR family DNA-binding domain-containing protein [Blautia sp.]|nr:LytTR family DNA-binding domain-containing protein [Lachnoclostridium sp.]MCM1211132.1 LytTR family DNA-binding domain-containing protein [Blautia sp.]
MKTILIVEDNSKSKEMLIKIIKDLKTDVLIKTASSQEEASIMAMGSSIDLFMLDIILDVSNPGDVSGIQFAEQIRTLPRYKYTPIIFITALEDPALYAYGDIHCFYYVEKPYDAAKVAAVIAEALEFPGVNRQSRNIFFRKDGILYKKEVSEILYIENSRLGQIIHCTNGDLKLHYKPSKVILEELGEDQFVQCSRYLIVNRDYIDKIDTVNRYIQLKGREERIDLGSSYKKKIINELVRVYK